MFVSYEQLNPDDAFGMIMMKHFISLGSPLKYLSKYPNINSISHRYSDSGWESVNVIDMNTFYSVQVTDEERIRINQLECFDEEEEWHQKCSHYVLVVVGNGLGTGLVDSMQCSYGNSLTREKSHSNQLVNPLPWLLDKAPTQDFLRFGQLLQS